MFRIVFVLCSFGCKRSVFICKSYLSCASCCHRKIANQSEPTYYHTGTSCFQTTNGGEYDFVARMFMCIGMYVYICVCICI